MRACRTYDTWLRIATDGKQFHPVLVENNLAVCGTVVHYNRRATHCGAIHYSAMARGPPFRKCTVSAKISANQGFLNGLCIRNYPDPDRLLARSWFAPSSVFDQATALRLLRYCLSYCSILGAVGNESDDVLEKVRSGAT